MAYIAVQSKVLILLKYIQCFVAAAIEYWVFVLGICS